MTNNKRKSSPRSLGKVSRVAPGKRPKARAPVPKSGGAGSIPAGGSKLPPCVECGATDWTEMECPECYALKKTCCETAGAGCRCFACEGA